MTRLARATRLAPALVAVALVAAGCATSVAQSDVESEIATQFDAEVPDGEASCPGDLEATEGATLDCTLTDTEGTEYDVKVTVTSAEGDTANFDMEIVGTE